MIKCCDDQNAPVKNLQNNNTFLIQKSIFKSKKHILNFCIKQNQSANLILKAFLCLSFWTLQQAGRRNKQNENKTNR